MKSYTKADVVILERYWTQLDEFENTLSMLPLEEKQDGKYLRMQMIVGALKELFAEFKPELKVIIQMRYFDQHNAYEWEEIADELLFSRSKTLRLRNVIIDETARAIGWV